jgi:UDP-N-acetylmuramoylalanine-D-glutamate ligase
MGKNVNQQNISEWLGLQKMLIPNIAVLGCGYWGKNLVRIFHQLGALQLVCDTTEQGRATAAATAPGCDILSGPEMVLSSSVLAVD